MGTHRSALVVLGAAGVLLVVLLGTTAGGLGPVHVGRSTAGQSHSTPAPSSSGGSGQRDEHGGSTSAPARAPDLSWLPTGGQMLLVIVIAAIAVTALATVRITFIRRRRVAPAQARVIAAAEEPEPEQTAGSLQSLLGEGLSTLEKGTPRNAIVAAWIQLEDFAVGLGLPKHPADTPAEFVARALATYDLDTDALQRLADLYREARFSTHQLGEEHRDRARACLRQLTGMVVP